jgi:hypothetical protein
MKHYKTKIGRLDALSSGLATSDEPDGEPAKKPVATVRIGGDGCA